MKYSIVVLALFSICLLSVQAGTINQDKRFLGSVTSWINNNIVNPINDHVINPISSGITQVTGELKKKSSYLIHELYFISNCIKTETSSF